jgi:hypothetical protein
MATVSSFRFDFVSNPVLQPGQVTGVRIGPWDGFIDNSLNFAVWPFGLSTATRTMEVVSVRTRTRPIPPSGPTPLIMWSLSTLRTLAPIQSSSGSCSWTSSRGELRRFLMKAFVTYEHDGELVSLIVGPADGPPIAIVTEPGQ